MTQDGRSRPGSPCTFLPGRPRAEPLRIRSAISRTCADSTRGAISSTCHSGYSPAYAHPSYVSATSYLNTDTGELSPTAVTDTYAYLIEAARCVIQAGHAIAKLLIDTRLADETANAETALCQPFVLWDRLP